MTKVYGSLVGTPKQTAPFLPVDAAYEHSRDQILVRDTVELAALAVASTISLGKFGWETVIDPIGSDLYFDALTGGNSTIAIGDVTTTNVLATATDAHTAAGSMKVCKSVDIANWFKPLWSILGYASLAAAKLIGDKAELLAVIGTDAATGTVSWQIKGQERNA